MQWGCHGERVLRVDTGGGDTSGGGTHFPVPAGGVAMIRRNFAQRSVKTGLSDFDDRQKEREAKRKKRNKYQRRYSAWLRGEGPDPRRPEYVALKRKGENQNDRTHSSGSTWSDDYLEFLASNRPTEENR